MNSKRENIIVIVIACVAAVGLLPVAVLVFQEAWRLFWLAFPGLLVTGIIQYDIS